MINLKKNIWKRVALDSVLLSLKNGRNVNQFDDEGEYRVSRIQTIADGSFDLAKTKWTNDKVNNDDYLNEGDILVSHINSVEHIGKSAIVPKLEAKVIHGINLLRLVSDNKKIDNTFLFYFIKSDEFINQVLKYTKKAVNQASVKSTDIKQFQIPLPPLEEQKQIAALFQSIETALEQVDGQEKNLHQLKHKLLKDLFSEKQEFGNHLKAKDFETVKFEKIAINISERVEPKKTELTTYVGLEHLDADNLKIERTGTPDDVIGTKLKIYKGDIIFGKRRAYLRKVAVSHFNGIASAHSMILRANETHIEKDFLPYFMQSDTFMSRAVQISEGSLSPTIKNKTLAMQEFILPKKEKQKELISVFKKFDTTMEQLKQQKTTLKNLKVKLLNEILG
ncbi:MAG: restriction endonuclease subunit S [Bacteroidia bacterium]|nr:restriction endonuclease subunit S [Bacteroidia bacterium]MCF8446771.1 restriction endonuclease subunit S [Bacteroidia bacterium]